MNLRYEKKQLIIVDASDLDRFITKIYHREYAIVADLELMNDVSKSVSVKKEPLDTWDQKKLDNWKASGRENCMLRILMADLCNRDLIEPGEYLIKISW